MFSVKKVLVINLLLEECQENKIEDVYSTEEKKLILGDIKKFDYFMVNNSNFDGMYVLYTDENKEEADKELSNYEAYTKPYSKKLCIRILNEFKMYLEKEKNTGKEFSSTISPLWPTCDPATRTISETESRLSPIYKQHEIPDELKDKSNDVVESEIKKELAKLILVNIDSKSFTVKLDTDNLIVNSYLLEKDNGLIKSNLPSFISYLKNIKDENGYIYVAVTMEIPDTPDEINVWDKVFEIITDDAICSTEIRNLFYNFKKSLENNRSRENVRTTSKNFEENETVDTDVIGIKEWAAAGIKHNTDGTCEQYTTITIIDYEDDNVFDTTIFNLTKAHSLSGVLKMDFVEVPKSNGEIIILAFKYSTNIIDEKLYIIKYNNTMDSYLLLPFDNVTRINKNSLKIKLAVSQEILARTIKLQDVTSLHDRIVEINEYNKKHAEVMKQQGGFFNINNPIYAQTLQSQCMSSMGYKHNNLSGTWEPQR